MVSPEPGPNMMWNTKYSPMDSQNYSTKAMPVSVEQARQDALHYLNSSGQIYTVEKSPDTFYGYYTMHILENNKIIGMLSVNGNSGQVWVHTWHGSYRKMVSYGEAVPTR